MTRPPAHRAASSRPVEAAALDGTKEQLHVVDQARHRAIMTQATLSWQACTSHAALKDLVGGGLMHSILSFAERFAFGSGWPASVISLILTVPPSGRVSQSLEYLRVFRDALRMSWLKRSAPPGVQVSERGFLDLAGRDEGLSVREMTMRFRDLVSADLDWADARKASFRRRAFLINLSVLFLTAASTVVLGFSTSASRASYALPMVALVTLLGGVEAFWNWRSRWILMEETRYKLNRLRDGMDYYLVTTSEVAMKQQRLDEFFQEQQAIWAEVSGRWLVGHRAAQFRHDVDPGAAFPTSLGGQGTPRP